MSRLSEILSTRLSPSSHGFARHLVSPLLAFSPDFSSSAAFEASADGLRERFAQTIGYPPPELLSVAESTEGAQFARMGDARVCLVPAGMTAWTVHLYEAFLPVRVGDLILS